MSVAAAVTHSPGLDAPGTRPNVTAKVQVATDWLTVW